MQTIRAPIQAELDVVNELIVANLESDVDLVENVGHHIVDAGGKRLRPILALLSARCCNYPGSDHIKFAAVIEFIHTATLLHDDVVDVSTLRRGRPTANAEFGNALSILVGDFLYTRAFQLMVEIGNMAIMRDMAHTTNLIAEGEVLQLVRAGDPETTERQYLEVIERKTAILFASACYGAAAFTGAGDSVANALRTYGLNTGIAFQIIDDVLDYEGDPARTGKNIGDDLGEGKPTLPLIHVLANGSEDQKARVAHAIRHKTAADIDGVLEAVRDRGSLDFARDRATAYREAALAALDALPDNACRDAMAAIADLSTSRNH